MTNPVVKICCIGSVAEAQLAVAHGAAMLGLVSQMPSGPGVISDQRIAQITAAVLPPTENFLLCARSVLCTTLKAVLSYDPSLRIPSVLQLKEANPILSNSSETAAKVPTTPGTSPI